MNLALCAEKIRINLFPSRPMIQELIIHLGDKKTGSTSIQSMLCNKAWVSQSREIVYASDNFHCRPLANAIKRKTKFPLILEQKIRPIRDLLLQSDAHWGIISSEHFEGVSPQLLHEAIEDYLPEFKDNMRLLAYVRPHIDRFASSFSERTKLGDFSGSLEDLHEKFNKIDFLKYSPRLRSWKNVFGEKFTARPFVRSRLVDSDVVSDFLSFVSSSLEIKSTKVDKSNVSLCVEDLALIRSLHGFFGETYVDLIQKRTMAAVGRRLGGLLAENNINGAKLLVHHELAAIMKDEYMLDAIEVDSEFFSDYDSPMQVALVEYCDKAPLLPQSLDPRDHFSDEYLCRINAFSQLLGRIIIADQQAFIDASIPQERHDTKVYRNLQLKKQGIKNIKKK